MEWRRKYQGVSLVELLVALAILGVALIPLLGVFTHALKTTEHSNKRTIAINLARDLQEEVRSRAFAEPDLPTLGSGISPYFPNGTTPFPFGCEECPSHGGTAFVDGTDSRLAKFDDVDDYDGWCEGKDCSAPAWTCPGTSAADGLCGNHPALRAYDKTPYTGQGYPHYQGFTRRVEVFNIFQNASTAVTAGQYRGGWDPPRHTMQLGKGTYRASQPFNFYYLSNNALLELDNVLPKAKSHPNAVKHLTRLKIVKVTVTYTGAVTPDIKLEEVALVTMPVSKESGQ